MHGISLLFPLTAGSLKHYSLCFVKLIKKLCSFLFACPVDLNYVMLKPKSDLSVYKCVVLF